MGPQRLSSDPSASAPDRASSTRLPASDVQALPLRAREGRRRPGTEAGRLWRPCSAQAWGGESRARRWPRHVEAGSRLCGEASPVSTCERRRNSWGPDLLRRGHGAELQGQRVGRAAEQKGARACARPAQRVRPREDLGVWLGQWWARRAEAPAGMARGGGRHQQAAWGTPHPQHRREQRALMD